MGTLCEKSFMQIIEPLPGRVLIDIALSELSVFILNYGDDSFFKFAEKDAKHKGFFCLFFIQMLRRLRH